VCVCVCVCLEEEQSTGETAGHGRAVQVSLGRAHEKRTFIIFYIIMIRNQRLWTGKHASIGDVLETRRTRTVVQNICVSFNEN
jgi:hypothetical protein